MECLNHMLNKSSSDVPGSCKQVVIPNLLPKFLVLFLKSTETVVKSELMIHNPSKSKVFIIVFYLTLYPILHNRTTGPFYITNIIRLQRRYRAILSI